MSTTIYDHPWCVIDETLCDGKTGKPILSLCHGAKIMRPYPFSMTGICMSVKHQDGPVKLEPILEAHIKAQK